MWALLSYPDPTTGSPGGPVWDIDASDADEQVQRVIDAGITGAAVTQAGDLAGRCILTGFSECPLPQVNGGKGHSPPEPATLTETEEGREKFLSISGPLSARASSRPTIAPAPLGPRLRHQQIKGGSTPSLQVFDAAYLII